MWGLLGMVYEVILKCLLRNYDKYSCCKIFLLLLLFWCLVFGVVPSLLTDKSWRAVSQVMRPAKKINVFFLPFALPLLSKGTPLKCRGSLFVDCWTVHEYTLVLTLREFSKDQISVFIVGWVRYGVGITFLRSLENLVLTSLHYLSIKVGN